MAGDKGNLSQNQEGQQPSAALAEAYSFAAPVLQPLNHELAALQPPIKLHLDARTAMAAGLSQQLASVAPCPVFTLLGPKPFYPAAPVGLAYKSGSPGCFFGLRSPHPRLDLFVKNRLKWLTATYEAKAKQQLTSPREAVNHLWQKACDNDPSADLQGMIPRLMLGATSTEARELATMFYQLLFGLKAAGQQQIIEAARVQPVAGPGEVALEFIWTELSAGGLSPADPYAAVYELGDIWQAITALPLVMSLWQHAEAQPPAFASRLVQAAQLAEAKMTIDPSAYTAGTSPSAQRQLSALWLRTRYLLTADDFLSVQLLGQTLQLYRHRPDHDFYLRSSKWPQELASQPAPSPS